MGKFKIGKHINYILISMMLWGSFSCINSVDKEIDSTPDLNPEIIIKRREDGTLSSGNQVEEGGVVHGIRTTYYADGKTIYSRLTFNHGIKHGPAIWYYNNGQVFKHTGFDQGKRHGPTRKYHRSGKLLAEFDCEYGIVLPGLREYNEDGTMVTSYPDVIFREVNSLASKNRIDVEISCTKKSSGIKYFLLGEDNVITSRVYLFTESGKASLQYFVKPGDMLNKKIEIVAEIPTYFGNIMAKRLTYHLTATNLK